MLSHFQGVGFAVDVGYLGQSVNDCPKTLYLPLLTIVLKSSGLCAQSLSFLSRKRASLYHYPLSHFAV